MEWVLIAATVFALFLMWDRARHPKKYCQRCKGTGQQLSLISRRAHGTCRRCGGKGSLRR